MDVNKGTILKLSEGILRNPPGSLAVCYYHCKVYENGSNPDLYWFLLSNGQRYVAFQSDIDRSFDPEYHDFSDKVAEYEYESHSQLLNDYADGMFKPIQPLNF